jgi:hypothetical protein
MKMKIDPRKTLRRISACVGLILATSPISLATAGQISGMDGMDLVGEARMQALFWKVYDARLYAPGGMWSEKPPFALSLTYLRDLQGDKIAERSIQEIRKQGFTDELTLARWFEELMRIIPDVSDQNEIVGLADDNAHTQFYLDGELIGEIRDPDFTRAFFSIWLGEETSEPEFRNKLLGESS